MGLIKAIGGAIGGVTRDQWREYFYCDSIGRDVLCKKASKRTKGNNRGNDNIISNGSVISVADGQCMIIVDQGKVVEVCAEPGEFKYDTSTEPSIFCGNLGKSILDSFKAIGRRFSFSGDTAREQRVYFFNTKEIVGNKYGTATPVPFRVVDKNIGLDADISIRCNGEYSYKLSDPILFYTNVCGNVSEAYERSEIDSQLKSELMTALQPAFAKISGLGVRYSALPGYTSEIASALNDILSGKWKMLRGIEVASFGINSVSASEEDENMIKTLQKNAVMRDPTMAAATLVGAQAEAMKAAAGNENGAMMGFMGLGMAQQAGGANAAGLFAMGTPDKKEPVKDDSGASWKCACGKMNTGKFCSDCGAKKPEEGWKCTGCGKINKGRFCSECGMKKPEGAKTYKCDKCGWEPEDVNKPPKFCPNCGDVFDDRDAK